MIISCTTQRTVSEEGRGSEVENGKVPTDSLQIPETPREFRAVWVATVANIDWPSERGLSVEKQKQELVGILNRAASMNMNAVIFQVRPHADAMYDSQYEPWSAYLTGQMGKAPVPYYDPLEFAIEEAHKRGLELHAWFNPYRAHHPSDTSEIASNHVSKTDPDLVLQYGDYQWLDPGLEEVQELSRNVIMDVVKRYDVDGVHLDDYFYPYPSYDGGREFPDSLSWRKALAKNPDLNRDDWRRSNVNRFIKTVYRSIKEEKPYVKFGISPFGTWQPGYPAQTGGFNAYSRLYADARLWLREGWVDYFTPQIYNRIDRVIRPFPVMLQWWAEQNWHDRHIWPGLYTSRAAGSSGWPTEEITGQVYIARGHPGVTGSVHFSMQSLLPKWNSLVSEVTAAPYALPALVPASPWLDDRAPAQPSASLHRYSDKIEIELQAQKEEVRWWAVWSGTNGRWELDIIPGAQHTITFYGTPAAVWPQTIAVSAVDRNGNESSPEILRVSGEPQILEATSVKRKASHDGVNSSGMSINMVKRSEWGPPPAGYAANAVRRNLSEGGDLQFRDLKLKLKEMISGIDSSTIQSLNRMEYLLNFNGFSEARALESASYLITPAKLKKHRIDWFPVTGGLKPSPDTARIILKRNEVTEELSIAVGEALNWNGYHVGVLAVNKDKGALAGGLAELEVSTVSSLPISRAAALETGGASRRLRVPHMINKITLHHTGSAKPLTADEDPVKRLKNLYQWGQKSRNWWDVPYHYLVGLDGTVYEGRDSRYAGDTNTAYDTRGHLLIAVMGNYNKQKPTREQIDAISKLMSWAAGKYGLSAEDISAHYREADTSCPGVHLREVFEEGTFHHAVNPNYQKK